MELESLVSLEDIEEGEINVDENTAEDDSTRKSSLESLNFPVSLEVHYQQDGHFGEAILGLHISSLSLPKENSKHN